jgi:hypothetical protein
MWLEFAYSAPYHQAQMKFADWMMIAAILCGPVLAVQAQKWIEVAREKRNRRLNIFKRLMATRGAQLSLGRVEGLNMIDLEFAGRAKKNETVRTRWKNYFDHLCSVPQNPNEQQLATWTQRKDDLLAELLHDMGSAVGYKFDRVQILRGIYSPQGHANWEIETQLLRRLSIEILSGQRSLPLDVRSLPVPPSEQQLAERIPAPANAAHPNSVTRWRVKDPAPTHSDASCVVFATLFPT